MARVVTKPWGYEVIWAETDHYVGKVLHINKDHKLSRQYHVLKEETFMVQKGEMILEIGEPSNIQVYNLETGDVFHCAPNTIHRMIAVTDVDVIEVSTPQLDDVVRIEDDYGR